MEEEQEEEEEEKEEEADDDGIDAAGDAVSAAAAADEPDLALAGPPLANLAFDEGCLTRVAPRLDARALVLDGGAGATSAALAPRPARCCLLDTSPRPRDRQKSRMPAAA